MRDAPCLDPGQPQIDRLASWLYALVGTGPRSVFHNSPAHRPPPAGRDRVQDSIYGYGAQVGASSIPLLLYRALADAWASNVRMHVMPRLDEKPGSQRLRIGAFRRRRPANRPQYLPVRNRHARIRAPMPLRCMRVLPPSLRSSSRVPPLPPAPARPWSTVLLRLSGAVSALSGPLPLRGGLGRIPHWTGALLLRAAAAAERPRQRSPGATTCIATWPRPHIRAAPPHIHPPEVHAPHAHRRRL